MTKKKETNIDVRRSMLTLFLLFFPTILIIAVGLLINTWSHFLLLAVVLAFYQFVMLKNFVDTHFGEVLE